MLEPTIRQKEHYQPTRIFKSAESDALHSRILTHRPCQILARNRILYVIEPSRKSQSCNPPGWYLLHFVCYQQGSALILLPHSSEPKAVFISTVHRKPTPVKPSYIEDGYSIILTDAPKDLGGRLRRNCARTTPELPRKIY